MKFKDALKASAHYLYSEPSDAHLEVEVLHNYHRGTLSPEEQKRVQRHLMFCYSCSDTLLDLAKFLDYVQEAPAAQEFLSGEVDAAWEALRVLLQESDASPASTEQGCMPEADTHKP